MEKSELFFDPVTHAYTYQGKRVPSVSQILLDMGFIDTQWFTQEGRERGSLVHRAIEVHSRGAHCMKNPLIDMYIEAFKNFAKDCEWEPEIIETPMACLQYAGTPDQIGKFNGKPSVLDIKTGSISPVTGLQLAAYQKLYSLKSEGISLKRFAIQLTETGRYILTEYKERMDGYIWDAAVSIWWWKANNKIGGRYV